MSPRARLLWIVSGVILCAFFYIALEKDPALEKPQGEFLVRPYLQLGDNPTAQAEESFLLLWQSTDKNFGFAVEVKNEGESNWQSMPAPEYRLVKAPPLDPHRIYTAKLAGLKSGQPFEYRVFKDGQLAFQASARARKGPDQTCRFVVFGDLGTGSPGQKKIAYQTFMAKPDCVVLTGDIVYQNGRLSEYRKNFFPIFNSDSPSPDIGAPLISSTLFVAAPGNHDIDMATYLLSRNLDNFADGLGYFILWNQPLNGPLRQAGLPSTPVLVGNHKSRQESFLKCAGPSYPVMANFSFDYGNTHWTILDGDPYVDWTGEELRQWVKSDLENARAARWRLVAFHQPPFNSDQHGKHFFEQQMRVLCDLFESCHVDVVFSGHIHNYQRTPPLRFAAAGDSAASPDIRPKVVNGTFAFDRTYDGKSDTSPEGIIYVVSGGGGAPLTGRDDASDRSRWQEFTCAFVADRHSLTVVDAGENTLKVKQLSDDGSEIDRFEITKQPGPKPLLPAIK